MTSVRGTAAASLLALVLSACASLPERPALPLETTPGLRVETRLDRAIEPAEARHAGASGFRLLSLGTEAFVVRAHTARLAGRSLDVQSYIWHADLVGRFMTLQLLDAADRGVKVRLLLDDMDAREMNYGLAALAAHPNIEVRTFNPLSSRSGGLRKIGELITNAERLTHRMHNKSWIVDNRIAIVGGRNIGDEYYGASTEANFVDLDFVMVGPVVRDVSASFDRYWNSKAAYPIETLSPDGVNPAALVQLRTTLAPVRDEANASGYADLLRRDDAVQRILEGDWPIIWSGEYQFVADDPLKGARPSGVERSDVLRALEPSLRAVKHDLVLISPYFVPGKKGTAALGAIAERGVRVRVLTNSLAATDVAAVHGGYEQYRKALLESGIGLWELKPVSAAATSYSWFGSKKASLHTKALSMDGRELFVGSYNLDPRSTSLNCEQGVLVTSPVLAAELGELFAEQLAPARAWRVSLAGGELSWTDGESVFTDDPQASFGRRFVAWLARVLPVEKQL